MNTLNFSILINAPKEKVWNTMLEDATYRQWTKPFNETSYYKGDWSEGSKILFLGTDKEGGVEGGMSSVIAKNIPFKYVSIRHIGMIENGVEKPWGGEGGSFENYTFTEKDAGTQVDIELTNIPDSPKEMADMMNVMWPKALAALKTLAEK
jgi:uncharacterized protein YndB with AHSA1/START domain